MKFRKLILGINAAMLAASCNTLAEEPVNLEKIMVTGQKIDRTLKETPNSVVVVTNEQLEKQNAQNITDVFTGMANVAGELGQGFNIRGIDAFNVSGGGNSYLVTMYLDGAPLPYRVANSGAVPVWDLSQIEVFRGPQSTLQGRNALAGAIHLRTQDPTYEWGGKAKLTLGNLGQKEYAFAGGGALIDDLLAFRVSVEDKTLDGDIYNETRNEESNYEESATIRGKLLFQPTDDLTALLTLTNTESELGPQWATFNYGESVYDRETWFNSDIWSRTDTDIATLEVTWDISDELSLVTVLTTNESEYGYNWDGDLTAEQLVADNEYNRVDKTHSQELRLTYDGDKLEAVVGFYASQLAVSDLATGERYIGLESAIGVDFSTAVVGFLMQNGFDQATSIGLAGQVVPLYPDIDPIVLSLNSSLTQDVDSISLYSDFKYSLTDSIDILAGLRFDNEEQTNSSDTIYLINNTLPDPSVFDAQTGLLISGINAYLTSFADSASGVEPPSSADFDAFLPKLGISYHVNDKITTSLIYQKGYRSGGVGTNTADNYLYTYDAEYTDNLELSYRSVWLNGSLMLNANAFYTKWTDQQVQNQLSTRQYDIVTQNAGESEVKGFEVEAYYYPTSRLSVNAGLGYAHSEFIDFTYNIAGTDIERDLSGRSFADAPQWTANIAVEYEFESGVFTNINASYQDKSTAYLDPERSLGVAGLDPHNDGRTLINAQAGYDFGNFLVRVDVRNLLDEEYISQYFSDAVDSDAVDAYGDHQLGRARQVSVSLQAKF
ncbi:TonB-dependent receptor [Paraglaciecola marina]|uniref:TonB-dependent receptor n=1 Tax=Paraglaciecola marina TaxID=2500157 RepID=UPI0010602CB0|nr:TonB-dependent receptor [Paraglaciecola marina]